MILQEIPIKKTPINDTLGNPFKKKTPINETPGNPFKKNTNQ